MPSTPFPVALWRLNERGELSARQELACENDAPAHSPCQEQFERPPVGLEDQPMLDHRDQFQSRHPAFLAIYSKPADCCQCFVEVGVDGEGLRGQAQAITSVRRIAIHGRIEKERVCRAALRAGSLSRPNPYIRRSLAALAGWVRYPTQSKDLAPGGDSLASKQSRNQIQSARLNSAGCPAPA